MSIHRAHAVRPDPADPPRTGDQVPESLYWSLYYEYPERCFEWNNGRLEEKQVSDHLTVYLYFWFVGLLQAYVRTHPIATILGLETGFRLALPDKVVIRRPDLGVVLHANPQQPRPLDRSYRGVFDLCVKALSDSNREEIERDTVAKPQEFSAGGVKEYYILQHNEAYRAFHALSQDGVHRSLVGTDGILRSQALPGFRFRESDLLARPPLASLRHDPVYRGYLYPEWVETEEARDKVAQELHQAAQERDRALQQRDAARREQGRLETGRSEAIVRLHRMGLSSEQIGQALQIDPLTVGEVLRSH